MSVMSDYDEACPTPSPTVQHAEQKSDFVADDPTTMGGQRRGAILRVMWISESINEHPFVGDFVKVLSFSATGGLDVDNIRTGERCYIRWEVMFPVPYSKSCKCSTSWCRCIYETYEDFMKRQPTRGGKVVQLSDPNTQVGQTVGATLQVRHIPWYPDNFGPTLSIQPGDFVKVLDFSKDNSMKLKGKNLRTGGEGILYWNAFKNVNTREVCSCDRYTCYCKYDDFEKSMAYKKRVWG